MMLKGRARGGAQACAAHLLNAADNEHVDVFELRGFASDTLPGALNEVYAISRGTRCKQFLYSLSLSPPPSEDVSVADFVEAIELTEQRLGLAGQSRAIVFHEKKGRRHAHCVWSRINVAEMKAIQLSFDGRRLKALSRDLFLQHGWQMPPGLTDRRNRNPKNFSHAEWQQARRVGADPRHIKTAIAEAWAISDSKTAFVQALDERGFVLARGDRRGFVAVDIQGEVHSIPRKAGVKTKQVRERLGDEADLPGVDQARAEIAGAMLDNIERFRGELDQGSETAAADFERRRSELVRRQRTERQSLKETQERRQIIEAKARQKRFQGGVKGLWGRIRGEHSRVRKQNELEAAVAAKRDTAEHDVLIAKHLSQRRHLNIFLLKERRDYGRKRLRLERGARRYTEMTGPSYES
ncbi:MAG: relaxase/mobilization nuclease domain-containing protein [Pseudomonadota bacterium]